MVSFMVEGDGIWAVNSDGSGYQAGGGQPVRHVPRAGDASRIERSVVPDVNLSYLL